VTVLLLGLYWFGHRVPLPLVNTAAVTSYSPVAMNLLMLGMGPLVTGFILIELFSLLTSPGRKLRKAGAAGRARLNRAALNTSLIVASVQAAGISRFLATMVGPDGTPFMTHPGVVSQLVVIVTLTAVTAAVFAMGNFLSGYGIGNGFALIMLADIGLSALSGWTFGEGESIVSITVLRTGLLLTAGALVLVFLYLRRADTAWLPAFPQGVFPISMSLGLFMALQYLGQLGIQSPYGNRQAIPFAAALVLILPLSWLGFHLFSSRPRLAANLQETEEFLDELAPVLRKRAVYATAILALGTAGELAWGQFWPGTLVLSFLNVVMIAAIALDLWDQFRFRRQRGATALLVQLDNVHFSYRLEERLQEEGIDALARGHQFRSLFFFFGPLFKIDVLVPREQLPRARQIVAELETAAEIKVF
jgi:hypothetical protein